MKNHIFQTRGSFCFTCGDCLPTITIAYQTWGQLNANRDNAILINHALSGSQHLAGHCSKSLANNDFWSQEMHTGWWDGLVGSGKVYDTDKYFIICYNYLGGCYGTTGPSSIDERTGKPYGAKFPRVSIIDQVNIALLLLKELRVTELYAIIGPSVGGLIALAFAYLYPEKVKRVVSIASGFHTTTLNKLILLEQILAIENDSNFQHGDYDLAKPPRQGLALARMISHKTFVHLDAIERRAKKEISQPSSLSWYQVQDTVQSYMLHQGHKFAQRFDANTYLRILDMWASFSIFDVAECEIGGAVFSKRHQQQKYLVFSIDSDFCFYPEEQAELVALLKKDNQQVTHITVHSDKGHDSFLLDLDLYTPHIQQMLTKN